jgi:phosphatidylserine/phosphatidylglycerophosphate/cardiolipin synthase-like enzyme
MTFNFTHSTFKNERNFALIVDDPQKIKQIAAIFSADWHHIPIENTTLDLILSPNDSRKKLMLHIAQAQRDIRIYAQHINDYQIVGVLAKAAKRGVTVQLLLSSRLPQKQEHYLARAGVKIHYSKNLIIHAKAFNIDDQLAIIGSINLTRASLDDNRELSIVTRDPSVIKQLNTTFIKDWNKNSSASSNDIPSLIANHFTLMPIRHFIHYFGRKIYRDFFSKASLIRTYN